LVESMVISRQAYVISIHSAAIFTAAHRSFPERRQVEELSRSA
jgi:hypothetical protein